MRRRAVLAAAVLTGVVTGAAFTLPAAAVEAGDGRWVDEVFGVSEAHAEGLTGEGTVVAVIDGPVNPAVPTLVGADLQVHEPSFCFQDGVPRPATSDDPALAGHGTNTDSYLVGTGAGYPGQTGVEGVAPGATVRHYTAWFDAPGGDEAAECLDEHGEPTGRLGEAMEQAMDDGADLITVSAGMQMDVEVLDAMVRALNSGVIVLGAVPNPLESTITGQSPADANGAIGVQAIDAEGRVDAFDVDPAYDPYYTTVAAPGSGLLTQGDDTSWETQVIRSGTSIATPITAGFLAVVKQRYPEATADQLIQSLIRNTWADDHELEFSLEDGLGYGPVSLRHMLRVDPTGYPDENPLLSDDDLARPTLEEIAAGAATQPPPAGGATSPEPPAETPSWLVPTIVGASILGVLVVAGIIVLVVVLARRRPRPTSASEPAPTSPERTLDGTQ